MTKKVQEVSLSTRTARMRLEPRKQPYIRAVAPGVHLAYRRSTVPRKAGSWLVRRYGGDKKYVLHILGVADDFPDMPPSAGAMTYEQAEAAARQWGQEHARAERAESSGGPTVRQAVADYIAARKKRSESAGLDADQRLSFHVLGAPLAELKLAALTERDLERWREGLQRGGKGAKSNAPPLAPATLARLFNDLRAALNAATRKAKLSAEISQTIRDGLRAPENPDRARDIQALSDADVRRIVEAAYGIDEDFGALVLLLASTGARFSQVTRLRVADLQLSNARIMLPVSRKGRGTKARSHLALPLPDDALARLRPLVVGRKGIETLLMRWHHRQVEGDRKSGRLPAWERDERRPWKTASEMTRPWLAALTAAELPSDVVPYALRSASIIRGLRGNLPVRLVAAAHDTSSAMIEKHYSAFILDASESLLRGALTSLAPASTASLRVVGRDEKP